MASGASSLPGVPGIAWHGHLTHSQRLCIPSSWGLCNWEAASCIEGSGPGSLVKGRCPVASVWLCGWTTFPPCTSAKGMLNRLEKKTGRKSWACHAPALALSHMRLQVPPGWSLKSLSRGSCLGLPTLGFIWVSHGSRQGGTHPPSHSSAP